MTLDQELQLLNKLADDLLQIDNLTAEIPKVREKADKAVRALIEKDLPRNTQKEPTKPEAPKQPKKPSEPRTITVSDRFGPDKPYRSLFVPWFFWGIMRKRRNKEWQETVDHENSVNAELHRNAMHKYDEQMRNYRKQVSNYEAAMEKYETDMKAHKAHSNDVSAAREQKRNENRVLYAAQIAAENDRVPAIERQISELRAAVKANTVLADQDKEIHLVRFVIEKLTTRRADSVMAALNLYDDKKRKEREFEARLEIDNMHRRLEAEQRRWEQQERDRAEAQYRHEQWEHNMEVQRTNRERLAEQKRTNDELERIRRAAEGK